MTKISTVSFDYLRGALDLDNNGTNSFTGSLESKDGSKGALANGFRYKVRIIAEDKTAKKIIASCYFGIYNFENTDPEKILEKEFSPSEEGTAEAFEWLQSVYDEA